MAIAIAACVLSIALGAALGLLPGRKNRVLGAIRTFGLAAALAVVLTHLLPAAFHTLGLKTLPLFVAGFAFPWGLTRLLARHRKRSQADHIALEVDYAGLVLHRLGDGLAMGAITGGSHHGHNHNDIIVALSAHTIPVVAVIMLAFGGHDRWKTGLLRAAGLALASVAGVGLGAEALPAWFEQTEAFVGAVVAGLLLHIVTHDLKANAPSTTTERFIDLAGVGAGLSIPLLGHGTHHDLPDSEAVLDRFESALIALGMDTAPWLLVGLIAGAMFQSLSGRVPKRWLSPRTRLGDAIRGTLTGIHQPLSSAHLLTASASLRKQKASPALVVAFLVATPALGFSTLLLTWGTLGWLFALLRFGGAVAIAVLAGVVVSRLVHDKNVVARPPGDDITATESPGVFKRAIDTFDELLGHVGAWMVAGVLLAALTEALLPDEAITLRGQPLLELLVVSAVAIPSYICPPSATPLGAVLIAKGLSPEAILAGLLLGPATNLAMLLFVKRAFGGRALVGTIVAVAVASWGLALAAAPVLPQTPYAPTVVLNSGSTLRIASSALLVLLLIRSIWHTGFRAWLLSLAGRGSNHEPTPEHGLPARLEFEPVARG